MSLDSIKQKLDRVTSVSQIHSPTVNLLIDVAKHILATSHEVGACYRLEERASHKSYELKEKNPFDFPSEEKPVTLMDFHIQYGNIISPSGLSKLFRKYKHFKDECAHEYIEDCYKYKTSKYYIYPKKTIHYLWEYASPVIKNKLRELSAQNVVTISASTVIPQFHGATVKLCEGVNLVGGNSCHN